MTDKNTAIRSICVYCGSQPGRDPAHMEAGRALGKSIAENGIRLVYGGGTKGIMGAVASGVLSNGGEVTGIIPEFLVDMEATRHSLGQLNELVITKDMHERKHMMFERSDAFVTLPGGVGTLEEIVEIMTWAQARPPCQADGLRQYQRFLEPDAGTGAAHARSGFHPPRASSTRSSSTR